MHLEKAETVKHRVERTQGTKIPTERAMDEHGRQHYHSQHQSFPTEQHTGQRSQGGICNHQGDATAQRFGRADIFTEVGRCHPGFSYSKGRQADHQHQQDNVLDVPGRPVDFLRYFQLGNRDFVK